MKKLVGVVFTILILLPVCAQATIIDFNDHQVGTIQSGNNYDGVTLHDFALINMTGGSIGSVIRAYDDSILNIFDGSLPPIISLENRSRLNLYGGIFDNTVMGASDQSEIHLYGYDFIFTEYSDHFLVEGKWANHLSFEFILFRTDYPSSHVVLHEIPEPCTVSLISFGLLILRRNLKIIRK